MLEQAAISGNKLHPAIKYNPIILGEINAMLEQAATFKNMNMLYLAIQQNPSILEEVNAMLERVATSRDINLFYQAIQQNPSILHVVYAIMLSRAIQQDRSIQEEVNVMLKQDVTSTNMNMLYRAIQQNPSILEEVDAIPFVNTPLHIAASAGHIEILGLKPSFGFKPIHVALHNNHYSLVDRLVEINKDLVRVKGKERLTPLHLLTHFLDICPDSIKDVNVRKETTLHIALSAIQEMVDWLKENTFKGADDLERSILNNILHLATICRNIQAIMLLIGSKKMDKNAENSSNQTALDLANSHPEIERILEGAKRSSSQLNESSTSISEKDMAYTSY
ncbi:hypothetical protein Ahy_B06g084143 [Arachis hypogaea]|uniref:Uncharacterized protein n=1 Tax=Arachis hypogaea TaxID=3818 RepID=A0A444YR47_ARAHY|nr:hypothetical protein Ahy_B06g084143 [Arachis hypogaea]